MNPKVSLIIPVYKVMEFLPECLRTIAAQTYDNMETILVDDGSPDDCGRLCDEYAASHENVIVIHQENCGLSGARNAGLRVATGEYVVFMDSDDYVTEDYIAYMMGLILKYHVDIAVGATAVFFYENRPVIEERDYPEEVLEQKDAIIKMLYNKGFGVSAWAKCYKRSLFEGVKYPLGKVFEDLPTTYKLFVKVPAVAFGRKPIYCYRKLRVGSINQQSVSQSSLNDGLSAGREVLDYMEENLPEAALAAKHRYAQKITEYPTQMRAPSEENKKIFTRLTDELRPIAKDVLADPGAYWLLKLKIRAMQAGYFPTRVLMRLLDFAKRHKK